MCEVQQLLHLVRARSLFSDFQLLHDCLTAYPIGSTLEVQHFDRIDDRTPVAMEEKHNKETVRLEVKIDFQSSIYASAPIQLESIKIEPTQTGFLLTKTVEFQGEYLPRFRDAPVDSGFKMTLSEGYKAIEWAKNVAAALSLLTKAPTFTMLKTVTQVSEPVERDGQLKISSMGHGEQTAEPPKVPLTVDLLRDALELVEKLSDSSKELLLRAIGWYARGIADTDPVYKFMDHWIALETLSNIYVGNIEPTKCSKCQTVLNRRPSRAVLREFLKSLGYDKFTNEVIKCSGIRANLFHRAGAEEDARSMQPTLSEHLRDCLFKSLQGLLGSN